MIRNMMKSFREFSFNSYRIPNDRTISSSLRPNKRNQKFGKKKYANIDR